MAQILESIKKAFKMLPELASAIGATVIGVILFALIIGVFVYQATTGGNINIDGNATTGSYLLLTQQSSNFSAVIGTVWSAITSITGFIVIGVIALIAVGILGKRMLGGSGKL